MTEEIPHWSRFRRARRDARDLLAQAIDAVTFIYAAIPTEIWLADDGLHVKIKALDRDEGGEIEADVRTDVPPFFWSLEHAIDWLYERVRFVWVHELNEAMHVDGRRRRDLHDAERSNRAVEPVEERYLTMSAAERFLLVMLIEEYEDSLEGDLQHDPASLVALRDKLR